MPPFNPNVTGTSAIAEVLPKDEYLLTIFEPKIFKRDWKEKGTGNDIHAVGLRYPVKVKEGHMQDKRQWCEFTLIQVNNGVAETSEAGVSAFKRFLMACLGYEPTAEGEQKFNSEYNDKDWSLDEDSGAMGDVYRLAVGKSAYCTLDIRPGENGTQFQKFGAWSRVNR